MKITKGKIIATMAICALLVATYCIGGGYAVKDSQPKGVLDTKVATEEGIEIKDDLEVTDSSLKKIEEATKTNTTENKNKEHLSAEEKLELAAKIGKDISSEGVEKGSVDYSAKSGMKIDSGTGKDRYMTDPVPEGKPIPIEPEDAKITDKKLTCTLSVSCATILDNMDCLDPEKVELVPEKGVIFSATEITFYEGESVFNVLLREMKANKIHMEFVNTPIYNSAYIEGIHNLYEFDCGELSGWMYKVNGWFPNYGCSRYQLKQGDVIEWVYTCDLGRDVGGYSAVGGES